MQLTQKRLKELFHYSQKTGDFVRKKTTSSKAKKGDIVGSVNWKGYLLVSINHKSYRLHRLVFLYVTGKWPRCRVDHINQVKHDNRWENLREVSNKDNHRNMKLSKNNISGFNGVSYDKTRKKWTAYIKVNDRVVHLGRFNSREDAIAVRKEANKKYNFHPNHGK